MKDPVILPRIIKEIQKLKAENQKLLDSEITVILGWHLFRDLKNELYDQCYCPPFSLDVSGLYNNGFYCYGIYIKCYDKSDPTYFEIKKEK